MKDFYYHTVKYRFSKGLLVSEEWRQLVTNFEGLRLKAYQDPVGIWTIGYGHTLGVKPNQVITEDRAIELLYKDVERFENSVNRLVKVPLTQYQFDALVSFTFNVGGANLAGSTLLRLLNEGHYNGAAQEFTEWVYADGQRLRGLIKRRKVESALFKGYDWFTVI